VRSIVRNLGAGAEVEAAGSRAMGVLYVDSPGLGRLEAADLHATFEQLSNEAAVAIENARLVREAEEKSRMERELAVAAEIQMALLPPQEFRRGSIEVAGLTVPCRAIGGDFYEYLELPNGRVGFALCDVSGKGPGAALLAAAIQGMLSATAEADPDPAVSIARLNRTLLRRSIDRRFATVAYGLIDDAGRLRLTSAGHNPSYLIRPGGGFSMLDKGGLMVGAFPGLAYEQDELTLAPGEMVLLYSDGVTEAEDEEGGQFEQERLDACLKDAGRLSPHELVHHVLETVRTFAGERPQADDITILVVRYAGAEAAAGAAS
jgi:serine phosphatase RsbU (regulator of sigma subunit)